MAERDESCPHCRDRRTPPTAPEAPAREVSDTPAPAREGDGLPGWAERLAAFVAAWERDRVSLDTPISAASDDTGQIHDLRPADLRAALAAAQGCRVIVRYQGVRRDGVGTTGVIDVPCLAAWVRARFTAGWRSLVASVGGHEVGRIRPGGSWGPRTWWAESCSDACAREDRCTSLLTGGGRDGD